MCAPRSLAEPDVEMSAAERAAARKPKASLMIKLRVRREAGFYVHCILRYQLLLTSLSVVSFMLAVDAVFDRVEVQLALIFALLGLRFSVTSAIPIVPYTTLLDTYQNCCIVLLGLQALGELTTGFVSMGHSAATAPVRRKWRCWSIPPRAKIF